LTVKKLRYQAIVYLITVNFSLLFSSVGCQVVCDLMVNFTTFDAFPEAAAPGLMQLCKTLGFVFFFFKFLACGFVDTSLKTRTLKAQKGKGAKQIVIQKCLFFFMSHCLAF